MYQYTASLDTYNCPLRLLDEVHRARYEYMQASAFEIDHLHIHHIHLVVDLPPTSVLTDRFLKSIWSYVGHIFINSIFLKFLIYLSSL
jgi:hypothetical protein